MNTKDNQSSIKEILDKIKQKTTLIPHSGFKEENPDIVIFEEDEFIEFLDTLHHRNGQHPIAFGNIKNISEIVKLWTKEVPTLIGEWLEEEEGIDPEITISDPGLEPKINELKEKIVKKLKDKMETLILIDIRIPYNGVLIGYKKMNEEEDENLRETLFESADKEFADFLPTLVKEFLSQEITKIRSDVSKIAREKRIGMSEAFVIYSEEYGLSKAAKMVKQGSNIPHDSKILPKLKRIYSAVVFTDREHVI